MTARMVTCDFSKAVAKRIRIEVAGGICRTPNKKK